MTLRCLRVCARSNSFYENIEWKQRRLCNYHSIWLQVYRYGAYFGYFRAQIRQIEPILHDLELHGLDMIGYPTHISGWNGSGWRIQSIPTPEAPLNPGIIGMPRSAGSVLFP